MTWPFPYFDRIEIEYTLPDRFAALDDDETLIQHIYGSISGLALDSPDAPPGKTNLAVDLGSMRLAMIDLWESDAAHLAQTIDYDSADLTPFARLTDIAEASKHMDLPPEKILILDSIEIEREARGHQLGVYALTRACLTFGNESTLVALAAGTRENAEEADDDEILRYAKFWKKTLGLTEVKPRGELPLLVASASSQEKRWLDYVQSWTIPQAPQEAA